MLTLKDVYQMPGTPVALTYGVRSCWFPEVEGSYGSFLDDAACTQMEQEGRFKVRCIFERNFDGDRFADMHTIWFDDKPVMVVRDGGRGGRDYRDRKVTDKAAFIELAQYIRSKLNTEVDVDDLVDPEAKMYPEELFNFYGSTDFATELGHPPEPAVGGFSVIWEVNRILKGADPTYVLVEATPEHDPMPEYLRRRGHVMRKLRPLTEEEHSLNTRIRTVGVESGYSQFWFYVHCEERPAEGTAIVNG